jgi:hypothetical protein
MNIVPIRPATVVVCEDDLQVLIEPHQVRAARDGETLADMEPGRPGAWICSVDTRFIPRSMWHHMPPPGSVVQWRPVPLGGGGDKGGSRAVLQLVALFAINALVPGSGFGASLLRVGLQVVATALINNLIPINATGGGPRSFSAKAENNQARLGQPIPEVFGYCNTMPDLAAQPYNFYPPNPGRVVGVAQTLHVVLCLGEGQHHICRVANGDTDLLNYDEVDIVRVGPGQSTMDGPGSGVEEMDDQSIVDPRWVTNQDSAMVEMRPGQFVGPFTACGPERVVDQIGIDLIQPRGMTQEVRMRWRHEAQLIDDFEQPLGDWFTLGTHTTTTRSNVPCYVTTGDYTVPAGRYWVRSIRTDELDETNLQNIDQLSVLAVRGHVVDGDINISNCTFVCVRVRVNGQINGGLRFRVTHYRMLEAWNGATWDDEAITRNPAWAFAQVLRARGYPEERIDLTQLLALSSVWDSRYDSFDYKFSEQVSVYDALAMISKVGRAVPILRGSRWTVVRDAPQTLPVASYGMRNIVRGSMQLKPALAQTDSMRTLDLEYEDHRTKTWITVTAQIHNGVIYGYRGELQRAALGIPAPDQNRRGRIKFPGIIGENHALRTVTYTLADRYYRSVDVDFDTELDGQLPAPLDLVLFQHDVGNFGQTGDVVSWDLGTLTLTTTEPLEWTDGSHAIRLQRPVGSVTSAITVTRGADDYKAILASDPGFTPITDDAARERTRYVFGPLSAVGALAKVRGIVPSDERRIGMRLVLEDDRVHSVDAQWIAPDPLPPCVVADDEPFAFLDHFDDFAGTAIEDHEPDQAPDGFVWNLQSVGALTLNGASEVASTAGGTAINGGSEIAWTTVRPFYVEMVSTTFATGLTETADFTIDGSDGGATVQIGTVFPTGPRVMFIVNGATYPYNVTLTQHTARLVYNSDDTVSLYIDGVLQTTVAGLPPTVLTGFSLFVDGEVSASNKVDLVAIQPL